MRDTPTQPALPYHTQKTTTYQPKKQTKKPIKEVGGKRVALGIPGADAMRGMAAAMIPLGRIGSAAEAAGVIVFLASPLSAFITGQTIEVNGGSYM